MSRTELAQVMPCGEPRIGGVSQNNGFGSPPSFLWDIDALGDHRLLFVATLDHYLVVFYRQGEGHVGVGASLGELGKVLALDAGVFEGVLVVGKVWLVLVLTP